MWPSFELFACIPQSSVFLRHYINDFSSTVSSKLMRESLKEEESVKDISPDYISQLNDLYDDGTTLDQEYLLADTDDLDFLTIRVTSTDSFQNYDTLNKKVVLTLINKYFLTKKHRSGGFMFRLFNTIVFFLNGTLLSVVHQIRKI